MISRPIENSKQNAESLLEQWEQIASESPRMFSSDIARELRVSEGELLSAKIGKGNTRLTDQWIELLGQLSTLGFAKSITRNEFAVLEKNGIYPAFEHFGSHSMFVSDDIDMRLTLGKWRFAMAVSSIKPDGSESRSLQFFGADGMAFHKVFLLPQSDRSAYDELVKRFSAEDQSAGEHMSQKLPTTSLPDADVDCEGLLRSWGELEDTHGFFGLLARYQVSRQQAMRLASGNFTHRVTSASLGELLRAAAKLQLPIMIFVGNEGCLQIHKGEVGNVLPAFGWLNVMDPGVEVHVKEEEIDTAFLVEKPTVDGGIRSLELFEPTGQDILSVFGVRTEGKRQRSEWHNLLDDLAKHHSV